MTSWMPNFNQWHSSKDFTNIFRLQQMAVTQSMQNVMSGMANIMAGANNKMKNQNYQETMKRFMTEKERMAVMNEYVEDIMNGD